MSTFAVYAKDGASVFSGVGLDAEKVASLTHGTLLTVNEQGCTANGTIRCRVVEPVIGWVNADTLKEVPTRKPIVAVLHGTAANASIAKFQFGTIMPRLSSRVELVFIDGPRICSDDAPHVATMRKFFGKDQVLREFATATQDSRGWRTYINLEQAIDQAEEALRKQVQGGEPQALIGFSQGANFATMLAARAERQGKPFACCVLSCGARPGWVRQAPELFEAQLVTPALVVASENDPVVGDGPIEIAKLFKSPVVLRHSEGHKPLPRADKACLEELVTQICNFVVKHCVDQT